MTDFAIVPATSAHYTWITDSFRRSLQDAWPWGLIPRQALLEDLRRQAALGRCVVAVDRQDPDSFLGWVVCRPEVNEVIFGFVKYAVRRMGVGVALVTAAGVDLTKPVGIRYWTRAAERIARRPGYRLYARVTDDVEEAAA